MSYTSEPSSSSKASIKECSWCWRNNRLRHLDSTLPPERSGGGFHRSQDSRTVMPLGKSRELRLRITAAAQGRRAEAAEEVSASWWTVRSTRGKCG